MAGSNMKDLPECLCRRYRALDELIEELTVLAAAQDHRCPHSQDSNDASIKILCEFWNILKEDPDCNLSRVVRQRMSVNKNTPCNIKPQRLACYSMAEHDADENNMKGLPECLHRRYRALDELIEELTVLAAAQDKRCPHSEDNDASIKILCEFWNILKEDPDCNLSRVVRHRMGVNKNTPRNFKPQRLACYAMAEHDDNDHDGKYCCGHGASEAQEEEDSQQEETSKPIQFACCSSHPVSPTSTTVSPPLSKVLCDLKEAVSFDKKCNARIAELTKTQEELQDQIQQLEDREKEGTNLLKQAECMWSCMESAYKKKVKESLERQSDLLKQMKQVETSNSKWRKNKKDLELQLNSVDKCCLELKEKLQQKNNDCKCIKMDIDNYKKRTSDSSKQLEACRCSFNKKKKASDLKIASFSSQISNAKEVTEKEKIYKKDKETEGSQYLKTAREDLQKIYRLLLERRLENEDLKAEKEALLQELGILQETCEQCEEKCQIKENQLSDEIDKIEAKIAGFKLRCTKCQQSTNTGEGRKHCADCPRCAEERECLYKDGECHFDGAMECVCIATKQKFMDNVFENMYSILEQQAKTPAGKQVADAVLDSLRKSRNGKLSDVTRKRIQEFVLASVKKNLNLTVIGGAAKTRCEMDKDTYKQLMLCLNKVKVPTPTKADKNVSKIEPCSRWDDSSECHCPSGPKGCICTKAGKPQDDSRKLSCSGIKKDKQQDANKAKCPHKESKSVMERDIHAVPCQVGREVASRRRSSCNENKCSFSKNMRAAQCVLGPESLNDPPWTKMPHVPEISVLQDQIVCKCGPTPAKPCTCRGTKHLKKGVEQCDVSTCVSMRAQAIKELQPHEDDMKTIKEPEHIKRVSEENTDFYINEKLQKRKNTLQTKEGSSEQLQRSSTKHEDDNRRSLDSKVLKKPPGKRNRSASSHKHDHSSDLKKTPSGALALELNKKVIRKIEEKLKDHQTVQASVKKSDSGQFVVDFNAPKESKNNIFVFKKSQSGSLLMDKYENTEEDNSVEEKASVDSNYSVSVAVILDAPVQNETKQSQINLSKKSTVVDVNKVRKHVCHHHHNVKKKSFLQTASCLQNPACRNINENDRPKLFLIKIRDSQEDLDCSLAVLEATKSDNFILNVDKEYEKQYKKAMRQEFDCDFECPIELSKTLSGYIVIDFLENKDSVTVPNAILKRSCSGNVKIRRDSLKPDITKSLSSDGKKASVVFSNLMSRFPVLKKESLKVPNLTHKRSTSDSLLLEKAKMQLQSQQQILTESSKLVKKSESGHYAVILNKDSKKAFIHSLKNYVSGNSQGKLPMKRTSKGEIIIKLNNDTDEANLFDSLKISPSGNIYVLVDEDFLKKCNIDDISEEQLPKQEAAQNTQDSENKSVTTTCNAMPDITCDSSKCVCGEVIRHGEDEFHLDYFDAKCVSSFKFCSVDDSYHDCKKNKCHYKPPDRYSESEGLLNMEVRKQNSPHIVIKQCTCSPQNEKKMSDDPQLFYMYQSICPFHKDRYDTVSNELLEITGLCNKVDIAPKIDKEDVNGDNTPKVKSSVVSSLPAKSDYLEFLPPQLPPFLNGFKCM